MSGTDWELKGEEQWIFNFEKNTYGALAKSALNGVVENSDTISSGPDI